MRVETFMIESDWISAAVRDLEEAQARAAAEGRGAEILLAGGSTPEPVYRALAALPLAGPRPRLWLGDERAVPPGDPARNGTLISRCFSRVAWEGGVEFALWPEGRPPEAARAYEASLVAALGPSPRFDLALLGIGGDGHTAGLFPGDGASEVALSPPTAPAEGDRLAFATRAPSEPRERMSLGLEALAKVGVMRFLTRGEEKGAVLARLLAEEGKALPARRLAEAAREGGADLAFYHLDEGRGGAPKP